MRSLGQGRDLRVPAETLRIPQFRRFATRARLVGLVNG